MNPFKWLWRKIFRRKKKLDYTEFLPKSDRAITFPEVSIFCQVCEADKPKDVAYEEFVGWICPNCKHVICSKCLQMIKDAKGPVECSWWNCSSNEDKIDASEPIKKIAYILEQGTTDDFNKLKDAIGSGEHADAFISKVNVIVDDHIDFRNLKFKNAKEYEKWEKEQFSKFLNKPEVKIDLYGSLIRKGYKPIDDKKKRSEYASE